MSRQISHKTMRAVVGVIAFLLAPAVHLFAGVGLFPPLNSISISYWSDARDIFVGSLVAVGFFFAAYNGSGLKKDLEFYLSKVASVLIIIVALFPTKPKFDETNAPIWATNDLTPPEWVLSLSKLVRLEPNNIHVGAAMLFFVCLIIMMYFFSLRAMNKGALWRAFAYRIIALLMLVGIPLLMYFGDQQSWDYTTFIVEVWGLTLFGFGWFIAGTYRTVTDPQKL